MEIMKSKFYKKIQILLTILIFQAINPNLNQDSIFFKNSLALSPEQRLDNEEQEKLAREIFLEVRCLICSGQVIESSNNEFAHSMRQLIRQKISEGNSKRQIEEYLKEKYGSDILIKPDYKTISGIIIWLLPLLFIAVTLLSTMIFFKNKNSNN